MSRQLRLLKSNAQVKTYRTLKAYSLNDRQKKMLNALIEGFEGKLTSSKWAKITEISQDTASRDIQDLIDKGILLKEAAGGRRPSYTFNTQYLKL